MSGCGWQPNINWLRLTSSPDCAASRAVLEIRCLAKLRLNCETESGFSVMNKVVQYDAIRAMTPRMDVKRAQS